MARWRGREATGLSLSKDGFANNHDEKDRNENGQDETDAEDYCRQKEWNYRCITEMAGCEDEVIIAIDCLVFEIVTRPHNLLVMVTTPVSKE